MTDNLLLNIQNSVLAAINTTIIGIISFIPTLISALLVFVIGLILARWLKIAVIKFLNLVRLSDLIGSDNAKTFLKNAEITQKLENVIGELLVRYLVILVSFVAAANILGLSAVTVVFNSLLGYLPNVLAAIIILIVGVLFAGFLEKVVKGSLGGVDIKLSRLMGKLVSYIIFAFTVLATISQLGIAKNFIDTLFVGFVAMLALAFGLSLGLGSKDLVKNLLEDWYKNFRKDLR
ncbi:hypothetical protein HYS10_01620 [Candidatus Collierbacteria bacterium]|nr:hypothetical protein [Candidatus Collierbacteria bacterium]